VKSAWRKRVIVSCSCGEGVRRDVADETLVFVLAATVGGMGEGAGTVELACSCDLGEFGLGVEQGEMREEECEELGDLGGVVVDVLVPVVDERAAVRTCGGNDDRTFGQGDGGVPFNVETAGAVAERVNAETEG
jgi:hypothetical protein